MCFSCHQLKKELKNAELINEIYALRLNSCVIKIFHFNQAFYYLFEIESISFSPKVTLTLIYSSLSIKIYVNDSSNYKWLEGIIKTFLNKTYDNRVMIFNNRKLVNHILIKIRMVLFAPFGLEEFDLGKEWSWARSMYVVKQNDNIPIECLREIYQRSSKMPSQRF